MSLNKLGGAEVNGILKQAAATLRSQQARIAELEAAQASQARLEHAEKIASVAVDKGVLEAEDASEYARSLAGGDKDLDVVEDFVSRTVAGVSLGDALQKTASDGSSGLDGTGEDVLTRFLLNSNVGG